jgi:hypothetical protein
MDENQIHQYLDYALLSDEEMNNQENWKNFEDPLPRWEVV